MKQYIKWFAAIAVVGALAGCARTAPIDQVHTSVSAGHTQDQVKTAILKAGIQRQWVMSKPDRVLLKLANKPAIMWLKSVSLIPPPAMTSNMTAASTCRLLVERFTKTTTAGYAIWIKTSSLICQPAPICNYA